MSEIHLKGVDERELDTILAEDINFEGEMQFTKPLMIKGSFRGEIKASGDLYVGEGALVEARVDAKVINLRGHIKGNIRAHDRIELFSSARVDGDMHSPEIIMEAGAKFNGICTMPEFQKGD